MSHDSHNNNGHQENKPVAFTTPLILGAVTVFIILLFVSLGNPCHGCCAEGEKECAEKCEKGGKEAHGGHEEGHAAATHEEHAADHANTTDTTSPTSDTSDSTHTEPAKEEAHH